MINEENINKKHIKEIAEDIALQANITQEKAIEVIIKLMYLNGKLDSRYLDYFDYDSDFFVVNKWPKQGTEVVFMYHDIYNVIYNVDKDKYYAEYSDDDGVVCYMEEIEI